MKFLRLIIILICVFAFKTVNAQMHYEPRIGIGAKGGMTLSRTMFSPQVPQSFIMGYMGGLSFRYSEEKHFGLLAELNIQQRGWDRDFNLRWSKILVHTFLFQIFSLLWLRRR